MSEEKKLIAYEIHDHPTMPIQPAPITRDWMDAASQRFPYRCLPLVIANQNGWVIGSPCSFRVYWYGGMNKEDLEVQFDSGYPDPCVVSHFGQAVLTFSLPYLFRTPRGINLWVKGPSNYIRDGIQALEGVVESDWSPATFTMNWKVTRPNHWITFQQGEPICMIVPIPRGFLEHLEPVRMPLRTNPELHAQYKLWEKGRSQFLEGIAKHDQEVIKRGWQKDYFQGRDQQGGRFEEHQTRIDLKEFRRDG